MKTRKAPKGAETILGEKEQTERPMHAERQTMAETKEDLPRVPQLCWQKIPNIQAHS